MSRIVFLLEDRSMKVLLDGLLPRIFPNLEFLCVPHEGKQDLEKSVPRKLRAWTEPGVRFVVVRDADSSDCHELKAGLVRSAEGAGRTDTLVRIACRELEAWYFGAPEALAAAFRKPGLRGLSEQARFREPDTIVQPAKALSAIVPEFQKVSGARMMGQHLTRESRSPSYRVLLSGIERLAQDMLRAGQGRDDG